MWSGGLDLHVLVASTPRKPHTRLNDRNVQCVCGGLELYDQIWLSPSLARHRKGERSSTGGSAMAATGATTTLRRSPSRLSHGGLIALRRRSSPGRGSPQHKHSDRCGGAYVEATGVTLIAPQPSKV